MTKEKIKNVFFDLDGTLINSLKDIIVCVNHTLGYFNFQTLSDDIIKSFVGNGAKKLLTRSIKYSLMHSNSNTDKKNAENIKFENDIDTEKIISYYLSYYSKNCTNNTLLYDGVYDGLKKLKSKNINMFVLSNKPHEAVKETVKKLNIENYFISSIGDGLYNAIKPSGELFDILSKEYSLSKNNSVMVGDGIPDYEFAKNAKITPLIVLYGGITKREDLLKLNCDYYFNSFSEVVDFVIENS